MDREGYTLVENPASHNGLGGLWTCRKSRKTLFQLVDKDLRRSARAIGVYAPPRDLIEEANKGTRNANRKPPPPR